MISPIVAMKLLNNKSDFFNNHPEFYSFMKENLGSDIEEGTVIEMKVMSPDIRVTSSIITITKEDLAFLEAVKAAMN